MSMAKDLANLEDLAASQHGYVTRAQSRELGISDVNLVRMTKRGDLQRVEHGIYRFRGAGYFRFEPVWIAWLRLDPEHSTFKRTRKPTEVVAGATAAWIYELGDLDPEPYEFVVSQRHQTRRSDIRFCRASLVRSEWEIVDGIPVTRPHRIVGDLLVRHTDVGHVIDIATDAGNRGLITSSEITTASESAPDPSAFLNAVSAGINR